MKSASVLILFLLIAAASPSPTLACGGHRGRCHGHGSFAMMPQAMVAPVALPMTYASPQMAQAPVAAQGAPVAVAPAQPTAPVDGVEPKYEYAASTSGQPAYYYTYDNSGKLVVAQWMDWVFRGGRAAGAPAPPLPIIGALRNR